MEKPPRTTLASSYDRIYTEEKYPFGSEPDPVVIEAAKRLSSGAHVLEYGAGQGRNALALAGGGCSVRAIDLSPVGVASMNERAEYLKRRNFVAEVGDARDELEGEYDLIVSTFMLHQLTPEEAVAFIEKVKVHTKEGGMNAIATFTSDGDFAEVDKHHFYPSIEQMRELYADWEILSQTQEKGRAKQTRSDGSPMVNVTTRIVARRPELG